MKKNLLVFGTLTLSTLIMMNVQAEAQNSQYSGSPSNQSNTQSRTLTQPRYVRSTNTTFVPQRQDFRKKMLERFDTNHDGKIDENERAQMRQARREHALAEPQEEQNSGQDGSRSTPAKSR
jgi:hypothetical protein